MNNSERFFDKVSSKSKAEPNHTSSRVIDSCKGYLAKDDKLLDFGCG